jgi:hypothetical protein
MVKDITIYVEGGGNDNNRLTRECRRGFSEFFKKLGITAKIVACGGRSNAYHRFCIGLKRNEHCFLLVDSEAPVKNNMNVWQHVYLREGDGWEKPNKARNEHLHFMVECMEAWFMADKDALARYYGKNFNQNALSSRTDIENIPKNELNKTLKIATRNTTKGEYSKGGHSFEILREIDATKLIVINKDENKPVIPSNIYAQRLYDTLQNL